MRPAHSRLKSETQREQLPPHDRFGAARPVDLRQ